METAAQGILTRDEMESRRLLAAQDLQNGLSQSQIARKFGVSRTTASRWHRALHRRGVESLRKRRATGRPSRLNREQHQGVVELFRLAHAPRVSTTTAGPPRDSPRRSIIASASATIPIMWAVSCINSGCASVIALRNRLSSLRRPLRSANRRRRASRYSRGLPLAFKNVP